MDQNFLIDAVSRKQAEIESTKQAEEKAEKDFTISQFQSIATALSAATKVLIQFLQSHEPKTEVKNFPKQIDGTDKVVKAVKGLEKTLKPQKIDNADVIKAITTLNASIAKIPDAMPRTEAVEVTNIAEMAKTLADGQKALTKALNSLEMSPKITVPKPTVTIQPTDTKSIVAELKKVKKEIIEKPITPTTHVPTDPLVRFTPTDIDDTGDIQYFGYIATDGEWYIRKYDRTGTYKTLRFNFGSGGAATYATAWTGRSGLTYTMWTT